MTTTTPRRGHLRSVAVPHSTTARVDRAPDTFDSTEAARDAAYRRLTTYILGLDVATLAAELRSGREAASALPHAA